MTLFTQIFPPNRTAKQQYFKNCADILVVSLHSEKNKLAKKLTSLRNKQNRFVPKGFFKFRIKNGHFIFTDIQLGKRFLTVCIAFLFFVGEKQNYFKLTWVWRGICIYYAAWQMRMHYVRCLHYTVLKNIWYHRIIYELVVCMFLLVVNFVALETTVFMLLEVL